MAYETRLEAIYRVIYNPLQTRMEIQYFVVGAGRLVSGTSTTVTAGSGAASVTAPRFLSGTSIVEISGDGALYVAAYLSGWSLTTHTSEGRLTLRPHFGGVSVTETDGSGRLSQRERVFGDSETITAGEGLLIIPVEIAGTSVTETDGVGDMLAPLPQPIEGPWITVSTGSGTLFVIANLRGPSLTRTTGRGILRVDDLATEVLEAENLARRLPDTYAKHRGSRIYRLFRVVGSELAQIRLALRTTGRYRDIDQATGATLDGIGRNVRQPRGQLSDRAYRTVIKAAIARHLSPGTVDVIKQIVAAMLDVPVTEINVRQMWTADPPEPAAVLITAPIGALAEFELTPAQFAVLMQRIVAAGVRVSSLVGGTFQLSEDLVIDPERGLADDEMTVGGTLSAYFDMGDEAELPLEG